MKHLPRRLMGPPSLSLMEHHHMQALEKQRSDLIAIIDRHPHSHGLHQRERRKLSAVTKEILKLSIRTPGML